MVVMHNRSERRVLEGLDVRGTDGEHSDAQLG